MREERSCKSEERVENHPQSYKNECEINGCRVLVSTQIPQFWDTATKSSGTVRTVRLMGTCSALVAFLSAGGRFWGVGAGGGGRGRKRRRKRRERRCVQCGALPGKDVRVTI